MSVIDFDPAKHRIVAVNVDPDSPECGNHFHLSLPDLVREAAELPTIDWSPVEQRIAAIESRPAPVFQPVDLAPINARVAAIESAVKDLRASRGEPQPVPVQIADHGARIEALEHLAGSHSELSSALTLCLQMAREGAARTALLEQEAKETHRTIATVMPALAAIARR
jgi:hypothetical protein